MLILALYLLIGMSASIWSGLRAKPRKYDSAVLIPLADPKLLFFWPLFLFVELVEAREKQTADQQVEQPMSNPSKTTGMVGVVQIALRPAGKIRIDDTFYDARSDGDFIAAGTDVIVTGSSLGELLVKRVSGVKADSEARETFGSS